MEGLSVPLCVFIYFCPRRNLLNMAVYSFTLLSFLCGTYSIHHSTWFLPELDVLCLQDRTNLAAVALKAGGEQHSSRAGYFVCPGAHEGWHLFLSLRILLAKLTAFFRPWLGHPDIQWETFFFLPFWIVSVSFLLTLLLLMFLFGESFSFFFFSEAMRQRKHLAGAKCS